MVRILSREIRESTLLFSIRLNSSDNFGSLKFIILSLTIFHSIQIFLDNPLKGMGGGEGGDCPIRYNHKVETELFVN